MKKSCLKSRGNSIIRIIFLLSDFLSRHRSRKLHLVLPRCMRSIARLIVNQTGMACSHSCPGLFNQWYILRFLSLQTRTAKYWTEMYLQNLSEITLVCYISTFDTSKLISIYLFPRYYFQKSCLIISHLL